MGGRMHFLLGFAAASLVASSAALPAARTTVWRNPQNSVHVRVAPCDVGMCGVVIWANDKAKADSARGGTPQLVGTQLFRDFREQSPKVWTGKVFIPDLNRTLKGKATRMAGNRLKLTGCLARKILCKSEIWTLVEQD